MWTLQSLDGANFEQKRESQEKGLSLLMRKKKSTKQLLLNLLLCQKKSTKQFHCHHALKQKKKKKLKVKSLFSSRF
jgi:hypothetical protein